MLAGYVGMQAVQRERAIDFGERHAANRDFADAQISAIPRPVSPFNWMVMVTEDNRYHHANVNLARETAPVAPSPDAGSIARLDAVYAPLYEAQWKTVHMYGSPSERDLAAKLGMQRTSLHAEVGDTRPHQ